MDYYLLQCEWHIIFIPSQEYLCYLRKMTLLKLKKWFSPVATNKGLKSLQWASTHCWPLVVGQHRSPTKPVPSCKRWRLKSHGRGSPLPQVATVVLCRLCNAGGFSRLDTTTQSYCRCQSDMEAPLVYGCYPVTLQRVYTTLISLDIAISENLIFGEKVVKKKLHCGFVLSLVS